MTAVDRAFIKAFSEVELRLPGPAPQATKPGAHADLASSMTKQPVREALVASGASSELAPLSSFGTSLKLADSSVRAEHEVESLAWPANCDKLVARAKPAWAAFSGQVLRSVERGQNIIGVTSTVRGEGRTTISLILAREIAAHGKRCVVVDADFEHPSLAESCGVASQIGWNQLLQAGEVSLGEVMIESLADRVTLVPWHGARPNAQAAGAMLRVAGAFAELSEQYDLVLVDVMPVVNRAGAVELGRLAKTIPFDAIYVVRDARWTLDEQLTDCVTELRLADLPVAGIIENFAPTAGTETQSTKGFLSAAKALVMTTRGTLGTSHA
ncbi:MAG TPA: AAA family ATPase [Pirellulales bacterium]|jgi:Mrp family chromosome partitioning ATPase|nr:AAA family ATPase [Pirellulales bacterium]